MSHDKLVEILADYFEPYDFDLRVHNFPSLDSFKNALQADDSFDLILGIKNTDIFFLQTDTLLVINEKLAKSKSEYQEMYRAGITPLFYNFLSFTYSTEIVKKPPQTFGQLTDGIYSKRFLLFSPDSTDIGRDFLLFTMGLWNNNGFRHFWSGFKQNIMLVSDNIEDGVDRFLAKEAIFCLTYSSFPNYIEQIEGQKRFNSLNFQEGGFRVIFGAAIPNRSGYRSMSETFIKYLNSEDFQNDIPSLLSMYPVSAKAYNQEESFLPPKPTVYYDTELKRLNTAGNFMDWLKTWKKEIAIIK